MSRGLIHIVLVFADGAWHGFEYILAREILLQTGTAFHKTSPMPGLRLPA